MTRLLRSSFVIARRDFSATVLSKAFIFFLLAPLFPLLMGGIFGGIGARVASRTGQPVVAAVIPAGEFDRLMAARAELQEGVPQGSLVRLTRFSPRRDVQAQVRQLLANHNPPFVAVLTGSLERPRVIGSLNDDPGTSGQLRLLITTALQVQPRIEPKIDVSNTGSSTGSLIEDRSTTAQIGQMLLFFLTILLSGMLLSQLIEEKSNKIIEVIAAAVPIDALFVGKLFAML